MIIYKDIFYPNAWMDLLLPYNMQKMIKMAIKRTDAYQRLVFRELPVLSHVISAEEQGSLGNGLQLYIFDCYSQPVGCNG